LPHAASGLPSPPTVGWLPCLPKGDRHPTTPGHAGQDACPSCDPCSIAVRNGMYSIGFFGSRETETRTKKLRAQTRCLQLPITRIHGTAAHSLDGDPAFASLAVGRDLGEHRAFHRKGDSSLRRTSRQRWLWLAKIWPQLRCPGILTSWIRSKSLRGSKLANSPLGSNRSVWFRRRSLRQSVRRARWRRRSR